MTYTDNNPISEFNHSLITGMYSKEFLQNSKNNLPISLKQSFLVLVLLQISRHVKALNQTKCEYYNYYHYWQ